MPYSGWNLIDADDCQPLISYGVEFMRGVRRGDVHTIFTWLTDQYHRRVESLRSPGCWGYNKRYIGDTRIWSKHAYGNAIDINAPQHNEGSPPTSPGGGFTTRQMIAIHALENESQGTLQCGADWTNNPDGMHWEIIGTPAQCRRFADKLRNGEFMDAPTVTEIWAIGEGRDERRETAWSKLKFVDNTIEDVDNRITALGNALTDLQATVNRLVGIVEDRLPQ